MTAQLITPSKCDKMVTANLKGIIVINLRVDEEHARRIYASCMLYGVQNSSKHELEYQESPLDSGRQNRDTPDSKNGSMCTRSDSIDLYNQFYLPKLQQQYKMELQEQIGKQVHQVICAR